MTESTELERLKSQVKELESNMDLLNKKFKESESMKSNFISNIMNEIYNPFSSILSMSENITSLKNENLEKAPDLARIIYREAAQLDFHLQNIFAAATIEAGLETIELTNFDLSEIANSLYKKFDLVIKNKNLKIISNLSADSDFMVYTDKNKLCLILTNLLSNSIKHSPDNGEIKLTIKEENNKLILELSDQGEGIPLDKTGEIFDRFKRLDDTVNSVKGGHGLGLSIVNSYLELLDGEIDINNDMGTIIHLIIPLDKFEDNEDDDLFSDEELF